MATHSDDVVTVAVALGGVGVVTRLRGWDGAVAGVDVLPVAVGSRVVGYALGSDGGAVVVGLAAVAARHGWRPVGVWRDRSGDAALGLDRPGFMHLLEHLEPLKVGVVLVPAAQVLSREEVMRLRMIREIHAAGAVLCVAPAARAAR